MSKKQQPTTIEELTSRQQSILLSADCDEIWASNADTGMWPLADLLALKRAGIVELVQTERTTDGTFKLYQITPEWLDRLQRYEIKQEGE